VLGSEKSDARAGNGESVRSRSLGAVAFRWLYRCAREARKIYLIFLDDDDKEEE
jgi:hypothetical protein